MDSRALVVLQLCHTFSIFDIGLNYTHLSLKLGTLLHLFCAHISTSLICTSPKNTIKIHWSLPWQCDQCIKVQGLCNSLHVMSCINICSLTTSWNCTYSIRAAEMSRPTSISQWHSDRSGLQCGDDHFLWVSARLHSDRRGLSHMFAWSQQKLESPHTSLWRWGPAVSFKLHLCLAVCEFHLQKQH